MKKFALAANFALAAMAASGSQCRDCPAQLAFLALTTMARFRSAGISSPALRSRMIPELATLNASPVVILGKARLLSLLQLLGVRVVVPQPVLDEVSVYSDEVLDALEECPWLLPIASPAIPDLITQWDLGIGESSVLALAIAEANAVAVLDDFAARKCASALGIKVKGTLGLALLAKRKGIVKAAGPLVDQLRSAGLSLSDALVRDALRLVDE